MEMAQVLAGAPLGERPVVSFGYSIVSPLHWSSTGMGVFRNTSGHRVPLMINSEPMGGGTAPVTLAGCLVLANADALSGLVIAQLLERGRPVIFNLGFAHVLDMSSGLALTGAPENALLQARRVALHGEPLPVRHPPVGREAVQQLEVQPVQAKPYDWRPRRLRSSLAGRDVGARRPRRDVGRLDGLRTSRRLRSRLCGVARLRRGRLAAATRCGEKDQKNRCQPWKSHPTHHSKRLTPPPSATC